MLSGLNASTDSVLNRKYKRWIKRPNANLDSLSLGQIDSSQQHPVQQVVLVQICIISSTARSLFFPVTSRKGTEARRRTVVRLRPKHLRR